MMFEAKFRSTHSDLPTLFNGSLWPPAERRVAARRPEFARVTIADAAASVVTDFSCELPVTVTEDRPIDEALRDMIYAGVRALLVVRGDAVTGLITSYDIQGERPLQFLRGANFTRHDEIEVGHIMTPWEQVARLDWHSVGVARVYDIAKIFRRTSASHVVIFECPPREAGCFVRGLLSRTRLEGQLGQPL
ncbi:MAG: CBS domain-containing protein [Proteobacteria bacterium]|nr:CBS domain-containing protein [Pseudomonadota bacterium]